MKKRIFAFGLIFCMLLSGCGKKEEPSAKKTLPAEPAGELTGEPFYEKMQDNTRPIAVMIDNDDHRARPQMGLESAYMVYEIVVEGSATRFMALFKESDMEKIGPTRSSRHYFLDYAKEHDAIYVHAGWTDRAAAEITSRNVNNINGLTDSAPFYRDNTYDSTWHNLYTDLKKVSDVADQKGYRRETDKKPFAYNKTCVTPKGDSATRLTIPYAGFYKVEFKYNAENKVYERYVNGNPHNSQTGDVLTAKNILVYAVADVPLNDGIYAPRRDVLNIGAGEGYYLTEGVAVPITWEKQSHDGATVYKTQDGKTLSLNPGNTFVQLAPTSVGYTVE